MHLIMHAFSDIGVQTSEAPELHCRTSFSYLESTSVASMLHVQVYDIVIKALILSFVMHPQSSRC